MAAKIRHIAICAEDTGKLADFYRNTFGLHEVARQQPSDDGQTAIYLSDGYINLAILPARGRREGIDHFGIQVEERTLFTVEWELV